MTKFPSVKADFHNQRWHANFKCGSQIGQKTLQESMHKNKHSFEGVTDYT